MTCLRAFLLFLGIIKGQNNNRPCHPLTQHLPKPPLTTLTCLLFVIPLAACGELALDSIVDEQKIASFLADGINGNQGEVLDEVRLAREDIDKVSKDIDDLQGKTEQKNTPVIPNTPDVPVLPAFVNDPSIKVEQLVSYDTLSSLGADEQERVTYLLEHGMSSLSNLYPQDPVVYDKTQTRIEALLKISALETPRKLLIPAISIDSTTLVDNDRLLVLNEELDPARNPKLALDVFFDSQADPSDPPDLTFSGNSLLNAHHSALSIVDTVNHLSFHLHPYGIVGLAHKRILNTNNWSYHAFSAGIESPSDQLPQALTPGTYKYSTTHNLPLVLATDDFSSASMSNLERTAQIEMTLAASSHAISKLFLPFTNHTSYVLNNASPGSTFYSRIELSNSVTTSVQPFSRVSISASDLIIKHASSTGYSDSQVLSGSVALRFYGKDYNVLAGVVSLSMQLGPSNPVYRVFGVVALEQER